MPLRWQQPAVALGARERGREGAPPKRARVRDVQHRLRCVGDDRCLGLNPKAVAESVNFRGQQACAGVVKPHKDYTFMFDKVFGEDKNSKYNCERTTKEMLTTLLDGYYCSVFAYGATGTGKTFTMLGSEDCPGLVSLTASELYRCVDRLRSNSQSCDVAVAYMEVCNEVVRDLLCPKGPSLVVRDDPAKSIAISNLSIHNVKESGTLFEFLQKGNRNRTQHATHFNSESSRFHTIIQIYITQTENVTSTSKEIRVSKVSFVDLAGSERVAAGNKDIKDQIREGTKVHLSLLTLGNCFDALSKGGAQWVPYQDSKVTHILKDSLGGTCRTLLMAFVSPSKLSYTDTHNTLKYAVRAMKIELQAQKKVHNVNAHTPMYSSLVEEYKRKVEGLQRKLDKAENEKSKLEIQVVELKKSLATAKDALLQDQHTDAGSIVPASHNDALSTTSVLSLTIEANERSDDSRTAYFLDTTRKIYAARADIIRQKWENENILRASVLKENWK
nr:kinesin-like protein KIF18B [Rhipicephalus microplus]